MRKLIIIGIALIINGCGLFQAPPSPTPNTINQNLSRVTSGTIVNVVSLVPMDIPNPSQSKITNSAAFRVTDDIRDNLNAKVLISQNSLIVGVYTNDGKSCLVSWQAIYPDYRSLELNHGTLNIAELVNNTTCDPKSGISPGKLFHIVFK